LVNGIFDGVICAFQAHTDTAVLPDVVARIATVLPAEPVEIEERLVDQRRAALGVVERLVSPYREAAKWDPADHLCVAGSYFLLNRSVHAGRSGVSSSSSPADIADPQRR
jgi:hypothetical protein